MALRPVSPVQLVTRALRSVWSAYHASAWFVDRFRYTRATFGTLCAAAFATGTEYAGSTGTRVPNFRARRKHGHAVGSSQRRDNLRRDPIIGPWFAASTSAYHLARSETLCDIVQEGAVYPTQLPIPINENSRHIQLFLHVVGYV